MGFSNGLNLLLGQKLAKRHFTDLPYESKVICFGKNFDQCAIPSFVHAGPEVPAKQSVSISLAEADLTTISGSQ